jgi:hypothetical protein
MNWIFDPKITHTGVAVGGHVLVGESIYSGQSRVNNPVFWVHKIKATPENQLREDDITIVRCDVASVQADTVEGLREKLHWMADNMANAVGQVMKDVYTKEG